MLFRSHKKDGDDDTAGANTGGTSTTSIGTGHSNTNPRTHRKRQGSASSVSLSTGDNSCDGGAVSGEGKETIRMPPSLTLSKIRSLKQQALAAAVKAKLEISTVALAIICKFVDSELHLFKFLTSLR